MKQFLKTSLKDKSSLVLSFLESLIKGEERKLNASSNDKEFWEQLRYFANLNKLTTFLPKTIAYPQQVLSNYHVFFDLRYKKTYENFSKLLLKNKIGFVLLKDLSYFDSSKFIFSGTDLDVLISPRDIKKVVQLLVESKYLYKNRPPHQITFIDPISNIDIDVHFLVSQPRYHEFTKTQVRNLTRGAFKAHTSEHLLTLEYQLLTMIVRYWTNDFLRGIKSVFEIYTFANYYRDRINWKLFFTIGTRQVDRNALLFVLLLSVRVCSDDKDIYSELVEKRLVIAVEYWYKKRKYFLQESTKNWWDSSEERTKKLILENHLLLLVIKHNVSFLRLLRVRIVYLLLAMYYNYLYES